MPTKPSPAMRIRSAPLVARISDELPLRRGVVIEVVARTVLKIGSSGSAADKPGMLTVTLLPDAVAVTPSVS